jgi:hypothetical protein
MMCRAELLTESRDAAAVAGALSADNVRMERLSIRTAAVGGKVSSSIESDSVGTMLASVDDLLCCQITAEGLI